MSKETEGFPSEELWCPSEIVGWTEYESFNLDEVGENAISSGLRGKFTALHLERVVPPQNGFLIQELIISSRRPLYRMMRSARLVIAQKIYADYPPDCFLEACTEHVPVSPYSGFPWRSRFVLELPLFVFSSWNWYFDLDLKLNPGLGGIKIVTMAAVGKLRRPIS